MSTVPSASDGASNGPPRITAPGSTISTRQRAPPRSSALAPTRIVPPEISIACTRPRIVMSPDATIRLERTVEPSGTSTVPAVCTEPPQCPLSSTASGRRTAPPQPGHTVDSANADASNDLAHR